MDSNSANVNREMIVFFELEAVIYSLKVTFLSQCDANKVPSWSYNSNPLLD
jgi:hypothetical protein